MRCLLQIITPNCLYFAIEADGSDMGLEEVLTSVKKVPKSSRKRQNSQSSGRKGQRVNDSLRNEPLDMLHTSWFDEKVNGDDELRRPVDRKSSEKPKSRKKSESKAEKAASNGKASRRSRLDSENMMRLGFGLDDIRPNGHGEPALDTKQRRRDARSSFEQAWSMDLFANRPDFRMDPLLSSGIGFGGRFESEAGTSGDAARKSLAAALDRQVGEEKGGRTRHRRRSDVKTDATKLSPDLTLDKPEALMTNTAAVLDTGNANAALANLPNHKVSFVVYANILTSH